MLRYPRTGQGATIMNPVSLTGILAVLCIAALPAVAGGEDASPVEKLAAATVNAVVPGSLKPPLAEKAGQIAAYLGTPDGVFLDQIVMNGLPTAVGVMIEQVQNANMATFTAEAWKGGTVGANLASKCRFGDWAGKLATSVGRAAGVVDVGVKLGQGETREAIISGTLTLLTELPNMPYIGEAVTKAGATGPVLGTAVAAFMIWRESEKQAAEATKSVAAESMMGAIQQMCLNRNRKLGEGDPFPTSRENLDKVWNRILTDSTFRGAFANYVKEDLGKDFPEPGWFDTVNEYVYGASATLIGVGTSPKEGYAKAAAGEHSPQSTVEDRLGAATVLKLQTMKFDFEPAIASLLNTLRAQTKASESGVLAIRAAREFMAKLDQMGLSLEQGMARVQKAATMLGVVTAYVRQSGPEIDKAISTNDYQTLLVHKKLITDYTRDVIAWLPPTGPLAAERKADFDQMKGYYGKICTALGQMKKDAAKIIQKPERPAELKQVSAPLSPEDLYQRYLLPNLKSYDWRGSGGPEAVKANFKALIDSRNRNALLAIVRAWSTGDYLRAVSDTSKEKDAAWTQPGYEGSIHEYKWKLAISKAPPAEVIQYKPAEEALKAWGIAGALYDKAYKVKIGLVDQEQAETLDWLNNGLAEYDRMLNEFGQRASEIKSSLPWIARYEETNGYSVLVSAEKRPGYGGIPPLDGPGSRYGRGAFAIAERSRDALAAISAARFYTDETWRSVMTETENTIRTWEQAARQWDAILEANQADINTIEAYLGPGVIRDARFEERLRARQDVTANISRMRSKSSVVADRLRSELDDIGSDMFWLRRVESNWETFLGKLKSHGLEPRQVTAAEYFRPPFTTSQDLGDYAIMEQPYLHILTGQERSAMLDDLQTFYTTSNLQGFVTRYMKYLKDDFDNYFGAIKGARVYGEENLFAICTNHTSANRKFSTTRSGVSGVGLGLVTSANLAKAGALSASAIPGTDEFSQKLDEIKRELPLYIYGVDELVSAGDPLYRPFSVSSLGGKYIAFVESLNRKRAEHGKILSEKAEETRQRNNALAQQKLPGLIATMQARIAKANSLMQAAGTIQAHDKKRIRELIDTLDAFDSRELMSDPYGDFYNLWASLIDRKSPVGTSATAVYEGVGEVRTELRKTVTRLSQMLSGSSEQVRAVIISFYQKFRDAYQAKNESLVVSYLDDTWSAGDGTTLADLQGHLRNSFSTFDAITYESTAPVIAESENGGVIIQYDLVITGRIYADNIRHEEKSTVVEEIRFDEQGAAHIARTLTGQFWSIH